MSLNTLGTDESGKVVTGLFWDLNPLSDLMFKLQKALGPERVMLSDGADYEFAAWATVFWDKKRERYVCPFDAKHRTAFEPLQGVLDGFRIEVDAAYPSDYFVLPPQLAAKVAEQQYSGVEFHDMPVLQGGEQIPKRGLRGVWLKPTAPAFRRQKVYSGQNGNRCYSCGHTPIICPGCYEPLSALCPQCGIECWARFSQRRPEGDNRILILPTPKEGLVLDASKWPGTDFAIYLGYGWPVVTRAVVDFLWSLGIHGLAATSLRTFVGDLTDEEFDRLVQRTSTPGGG